MSLKNSVVLILVFVLLLLTACGGGGGASYTAPISFNDASLKAMYFTASLDQSGGSISEFGDTTFDGKGNGTFAGIYSTSYRANQAENDSGTYSVNSNGAFTITGTGGSVMNCGLSASTTTAVCATVNDNTYQNISVLVTAGSSGYTNSSLNGTYYAASLDQYSGFISEFGSVAFDGQGNGTFAGAFSNSSGANQAESDAGTYAVNPNGAFTITGSSGSVMQCGMSADTNTAVCSSVNDPTYQNISVLVKAGTSGYSNSSLNGTYYMAKGDTNGGFNSEFGSMTFNGAGNFTTVGTLNSPTGANQSVSGSGTYSVNAGGTFTVTPSGGSVIQCGMSADTNTLVCATLSNTADQNIIVLVKT